MTNSCTMKKAVFLDRDGVINKAPVKNGRPFSPRNLEAFELAEGVKDTLMCLKERGYLNIIVTNQPDISRGLLAPQALEDIHTFIRKNLPVDDIYVCPHDDRDNCICRKPKPGMVLEAIKKWKIDLRRSFLIGDQWKDIDMGKKVGCRTILIDYAYNQDINPDWRINTITNVIDTVL